MVRVGERSRCNMIEGCQEEFYKTLVSSLIVPNDWVLDMAKQIEISMYSTAD